MICDGQIPRFDRRLNQGAQPRFVDVDITGLEGLHNPLVDIHTENFDPVSCKSAGGWQSDITEPDDADFVEVQSLLLESG